MKQIKLEVGKTYRNRKGEEIKITGYDEWHSFPYTGNDGESYRASGQWGWTGEPQDLIEEVTVSDANQKHNEMEVLALQVGKTYINRKGEEVKIVRKYDNDRPPYQGNNGNWYTESGKWNYFSKEDPEDLIEEIPETCHAFITPDEAKKVTATRYTFAIPDGMTKLTVEQVSNRIVVEMVPGKAPKPGAPECGKGKSSIPGATSRVLSNPN